MEQSVPGRGEVDMKKSFAGGNGRNGQQTSGSGTTVSGVFTSLI